METIKKKVLFINRDGALIENPPPTKKNLTVEQIKFAPGVLRNLYFIKKDLDYEVVFFTYQPGLAAVERSCLNDKRVQRKVIQTFEREGVTFDNILVETFTGSDGIPDFSYPPATMRRYMNSDYDLSESYVISSNRNDLLVARRLGCRCIMLGVQLETWGEREYALETWDLIRGHLTSGTRTATVCRKTDETDIRVSVNLDGTGRSDVSTGIGFFNHMLHQIGRHSGADVAIDVKGDLHVDEHHTIEDTAIALGDALRQALGNKAGIERYGFHLPMDDCQCSVLLDFGGRAWFEWDVVFRREKIGDLPTEMLHHFFKSLSDAAAMNLHIRAEGSNEHHKAEGVFKAFARAVKMAIRRDIYSNYLPTTKGVL